MKILPRILKVISAKNFIVRTLWNNAELGDIDFKPLLEIWHKGGEKDVSAP